MEMATTRILSNEARIEQFDLEGTVIYATKFIADLGRQWFDLVPLLQPKFQKLVFPEGIPYTRGKGFGTAKLGLIYELNQHSADQNDHLVDPRGFEPLASAMRMLRSSQLSYGPAMEHDNVKVRDYNARERSNAYVRENFMHSILTSACGGA